MKCRLKWAGLLPFVPLVEASRAEIAGEGRGNVIRRLQCDTSLRTCLVDRWRPETHTFHFRWGEMAPTLQDVSYLLGLPLAGDPIGPLREPPANWKLEMAQRFEGIIDEPMTEDDSENHGPKVAWLLSYEVSTIFIFCALLHASSYCWANVLPLYLCR